MTKKLALLVCVFMFLLQAHGQETSLPTSEGKIFFLSYMSSGTNLTTAMIQALTKREIAIIGGTPKKWVENNHSRLKAFNRLNLELDLSKPPIWRTHNTKGKKGDIIRNANQDKNKLVMVVRNPKECLVRQCRYSEKTLIKSVLTNTGGFAHFISNLQFFDDWSDENTKIIVYYEDLLDQPRTVAIKLLEFLEEDQRHLDFVFGDYEQFCEKVIKSYQSQTEERKNRSSGGNQKIFHSRKFSKRGMKKIDSHLRMNYPKLWDKYLARYETK